MASSGLTPFDRSNVKGFEELAKISDLSSPMSDERERDGGGEGERHRNKTPSFPSFFLIDSEAEIICARKWGGEIQVL